MKKILLLGGTSAIGSAAAREFAKEKASFVLAGRDEEKLSMVRDDLRTRGASQVEVFVADLADEATHDQIVSFAEEKLEGIDTLLVAYGSLGDEKKCWESFAETRKELETNFFSVVSFLTRFANIFEERGKGTLAVITSVAGDRGRKSNYVYGTAKGALSTFLQGLRNRLHGSGVHVLTIKPGFVDTPMTEDFEKGPLFVSAEVVGKGIYQAVRKKKDVVYIPWFWRYIMLVIVHIPEKLFKRLSI